MTNPDGDMWAAEQALARDENDTTDEDMAVAEAALNRDETEKMKI